MNRYEQIKKRAAKMKMAEAAAKNLAQESRFTHMKAAAFAACALFVSLLPAGGAALTIL